MVVPTRDLAMQVKLAFDSVNERYDDYYLFGKIA